jgi:hypothetical protein
MDRERIWPRAATIGLVRAGTAVVSRGHHAEAATVPAKQRRTQMKYQTKTLQATVGALATRVSRRSGRASPSGAQCDLAKEEETMKPRTRHPLARPLVLALAVAALAVPTAQARIPDGDNNPTPASQSVPPDGWQRNVIASDAGRDKRYGLPQDTSGQAQPFIRPEPRPPHVEPVAAPTDSSDGFDFRDAGVGFGIALGLALLATGLALTIRRRRHGGTLAGA